MVAQRLQPLVGLRLVLPTDGLRCNELCDGFAPAPRRRAPGGLARLDRVDAIGSKLALFSGAHASLG
jgi:hypothetical protein